MSKLVNFSLMIRSIAVITSALSVVVSELLRFTFPSLAGDIRHFTVASLIAIALTLLVTTRTTWRLLWAGARLINPSLYPDLNGEWTGEIETEDGRVLPVQATIRQDLLRTEVDLHTDTAKSVTLQATSATEGGQFRLYYSYRAEPNQAGWPVYNGTTTFHVKSTSARSLELSGRYYTDRKTAGTTRLTHVSSKQGT